MQKEVKFQTEEFVPAWASEYSEKKFSVFSTCFLSTKENSHKLNISEEVLRKDAQTILGNFLVAKLQYGDSTTHMPDEIIYGYFPKEQEIEFDESEEGIVKAKAYCVISKMYGNDFNDIFSTDNLRNTSVEMTVQVAEDDENEVVDFDIFGLTCLGRTVRGSCPDAQMQMVRFDKDEAESFFKEKDAVSILKKFAKDRKEIMEKEKYESHSIDTSKEAMYDGEWDCNQAKQDLVKEKDYNSLAPKVCLRLEEGWKDRQITKLGYPVMGLHDGKWVYFKKAIASALAYAKQENDEDIVNKVKKLYKKLDIEESRKEGESKMAEIEFAAVNIGDMWGKVYDALHSKYPDGDYGSVYRILDIYEDKGQKFAVIRHKDEDAMYRLDFTFTEDGVTLAENIVKVEIEIVETDEIRKFAEPEDAEKYKSFAEEDKKDEAEENKEEKLADDDDEKSDDNKDDSEDKKDEDKDEKDEEMSADDMKAEMARLQAEIDDRENIIMQKDAKMSEMEAELKELRDFKFACDQEKLATSVNALMTEVKECLSETQFEELRTEGMNCKMSELSGWTNRVKAVCFDAKASAPKVKKAKDEIWSFSAPIENQTNPQKNSLWD